MMENKNFDEEFKNRIKQIFEEQNDGAADESWKLLREKYPEKKRRDGIFWWISAVALLLTAFIFWFFQPNFLRPNSSKVVKQQPTDTVSTLPNRYSSTQKPTSSKVTADTNNTKKTSVKTVLNFANKHLPKTNKIAQNQIAADSENAKKTLVKTASDFISATVKNQQLVSAISKQEPQPVADNQKNTLFTDIKNTSDSTSKQNKISVSVLTDSIRKQTLAAVVNKTKSPATQATALQKEAKAVKKPFKKTAVFSLGLYAGSHVNYANGSNNQLGLGAGFSTDFRLNKNFKLSTGLGLMQNNLTYDQDISSISLNAANSNYSTLPASGTSSQIAILSSLDTRLVALDIPVNLVYNFFAGKNSISVSGGISSNTFVKEAYDYHYSNSTNSSQNIKSFNNFNFAKTLNFAAGFAYPLGKNQLQIEPFLKYPLGGSGSQQLQFGSAGINLKLNIQSFKQ